MADHYTEQVGQRLPDPQWIREMSAAGLVLLSLDYSPEAQYALAMRFQDAIDLITTVGWAPDATAAKADTFEIPVTDDLIQQLAHRRVDLAATNRHRLDDVDQNQPIPADVMAEITADRNAATELDRVIAAYTVARAT
jgi:hypothetical protein